MELIFDRAFSIMRGIMFDRAFPQVIGVRVLRSLTCFFVGQYVGAPWLCRNPARSRTPERTRHPPAAGMAATEAAKGVPRKGEERKRGGGKGEKRAQPPDPHRGVQDCGWGRARPPQKSSAAPLRQAGATAGFREVYPKLAGGYP